MVTENKIKNGTEGNAMTITALMRKGFKMNIQNPFIYIKTNEDEREVFDSATSIHLCTIYRTWTRLGGWGWSYKTNGGTSYASIKAAIKAYIAEYKTGRI